MKAVGIVYFLTTIVLLGTVNVSVYSEPNTTDLWDAIEAEDLAAIEALLEQDIDLNKGREADNRLPLMHATLHDKTSVIQLLLENGADVDTSDMVGNSCLMTAAFLGSVETVQVLIASGANLFVRNIGGEDVLDMLEVKWRMTNYYANEIYKLGVNREDVVAGRAKVLPIVNEAREQAARDNVWVALILGREDLVKLHVGNVEDIETIVTPEGSPILVAASALGHLEIVRYLLKAGADIESRDAFGSTSMLVAAMFGHRDVATLLIENEADISVSNYQGTDLKIALELDWDTTNLFANAIGLTLEKDELTESRTKIKQLVLARKESLDDSAPDESE